MIRLFAAAGVVLVHSIESSELEYWGNLFRFAVPFYLFASIYYQSLSLGRNTERTFGQYVVGRVKRLYLPFLAWSAIYLVARDIKRVTFLDAGAISLSLSHLWQGTAYHLWFLPFLLAVSVVQAIVHHTMLQRDRRWRWILSALAIAGGFAIATVPMPEFWNRTFDSSTYAYVQWWRVLPTACWALAFAWVMTTGPTIIAVSSTLGFAGLALAAGCLVKQALHGIQLIPRGLTGFGCMLAALAPWSGPAVSFMARIGRYGYGIYLCHVLIVELIRAISSRAQLGPSPWLDIVNFTLSFAGSLVLVQLLAGSKRLAWLNG
ncbi:MAG: acyltransferase [Anaerolineae bacterium]|nr:acyltransferase [Phycisphaerae bacterium]